MYLHLVIWPLLLRSSRRPPCQWCIFLEGWYILDRAWIKRYVDVLWGQFYSSTFFCLWGIVRCKSRQTIDLSATSTSLFQLDRSFVLFWPLYPVIDSNLMWKTSHADISQTLITSSSLFVSFYLFLVCRYSPILSYSLTYFWSSSDVSNQLPWILTRTSWTSPLWFDQPVSFTSLPLFHMVYAIGSCLSIEPFYNFHAMSQSENLDWAIL